MESCLADISKWMCLNLLKLNQDKIELFLFTPKTRVKEFSNCHLSFDGTIFSNASVIKNLGVYFDRTMSMEKQVNAVTKSCNIFGNISQKTHAKPLFAHLSRHV